MLPEDEGRVAGDTRAGLGQPGISAKEKEAVMRALGDFVLGENAKHD